MWAYKYNTVTTELDVLGLGMRDCLCEQCCRRRICQTNGFDFLNLISFKKKKY